MDDGRVTSPVVPNALAYFGAPGFCGVLGVPLGGAVVTGDWLGDPVFGGWLGLGFRPGLPG